MTMTLEGLRAAVSAWLQEDTGCWLPPSLLDEAARLALGEYNQALRATASLAGLDGASITSLPGEHAHLLVTGTAGQAAVGRAMRRAAAWGNAADAPGGVDGWGEARLADFRAGLEQARAAGLRAESAPWEAGGGWPLE